MNAALDHAEAERIGAHRELEEAAKHGGEAFSLDGRMVDLPVIRAAEATIAGAQK